MTAKEQAAFINDFRHLTRDMSGLVEAFKDAAPDAPVKEDYRLPSETDTRLAVARLGAAVIDLADKLVFVLAELPVDTVPKPAPGYDEHGTPPL
jgi:hypothetical protein